MPSSYRDTGLSASYTFQPLSNLVYTRDQQVTTCKGIVMGRLRSSQRQLEVEVMRFCFEKLGGSPAEQELLERVRSRTIRVLQTWGVHVDSGGLHVVSRASVARFWASPVCL